MYQAMSKTMQFFGQEECIKAPMPIEGMLNTYNDYVNARDAVFGSTQSAQNYKDMLKQRTKQELLRLSQTNRNAEDAYFALFSKLIRD